jgi:hypothetical protein
VDETATFVASDAVSAPRLFALFRLAPDSGMRQGELFALKWPDFDLASQTIHVCRSLEQVNGGGAYRASMPYAPRRGGREPPKAAAGGGLREAASYYCALPSVLFARAGFGPQSTICDKVSRAGGC